MHLLTIFVTALCCKSCLADQQVVLDPPVEIQITTVVSQQVKHHGLSPRQENARQDILKSLKRVEGCQDQNHPLLDALFAFRKYGERNMVELNRWREMYGYTSKYQKKILEQAVGYTQKIKTTEHLIWLNHHLCQEMVESALDFYEIDAQALDDHVNQAVANGKQPDRISVSQALKHFVRDWSDEGIHERQTFLCILKYVEELSPDLDARLRKPVRVMLPGAGLGRLGYEIESLHGFEVTLNEWSMYMNIVYHFLSTLPESSTRSIHPFIDNWSHQASTSDLNRSIEFPDAWINSTSITMIEGDFTSVFTSSPSKFDFVITHFFIDTARNLMAYLEMIHRTLKKGGYWINSGPLLYGSGPWVQLSLDEIIAVVEYMGFEFLETDEQCGKRTLAGKTVRGMAGIYGSSFRALNINAFKVQFWVARKK